MGYIRLEKDSDGIIDFIFDQPGKTVNTMGVDYQQAMDEAMVEVKNQIAVGGVYMLPVVSRNSFLPEVILKTCWRWI